MTQKGIAEIDIDRDELIQLTLDFCNIESPAGREAETGRKQAMDIDDLLRAGNVCPRLVLGVCNCEKPRPTR